MVVFTCQHCGASLQKPKVDKHYRTTCRHRTPSVTCVDCLKDFIGKEYDYHTQCLSEAQRYAANGTVINESLGKNKQERYCKMIQNLLYSTNLTSVQRELLSICSNYENVPRKQKKFHNFMNNVARAVKHTNDDIKAVFDILDTTWKNEVQSNTLNHSNSKSQTSVDSTFSSNETKDFDDSKEKSKNDYNQTKPQSDFSAHMSSIEDCQVHGNNGNSLNKSPVTTANDNVKCKKPKESEKLEQIINIEIKKKHNKRNGITKIENKKRTIQKESFVSKFDWSGVILRVLDSYPEKELSIKRLGKKVVFEYQCINPGHKTYEHLLTKFNRKVKKIEQLTIVNGKAKLLE